MSRHNSEILKVCSERGNLVLDYVYTTASTLTTKAGEKIASLLIIASFLLFNCILFVFNQMELDFHQSQEVFLFYKFNYKLYADIGGSSSYMWRKTVVI